MPCSNGALANLADGRHRRRPRAPRRDEPAHADRRFRAATGIPPGEWLQRERLRLAQRLLETTDEPIERVARRAGYDSSATMRAQFAPRLQTSPRAYRQTFRSGM